jgi:poly(3-hydroxybutyrate) depolymerase
MGTATDALRNVMETLNIDYQVDPERVYFTTED